jgi:hypothetical protein
MKELIPIPQDSFTRLKQEKSMEVGCQFVAVKLKDGRYFEQAVESEGCIIQVKGRRDIPFTESEVESVEVSSKPWNFRGGSS